MNNPIRVGVYGTWRGANLAALFQAHDDVEVVAGCDFNPQHLASFRTRFPNAATFDSYAELLQQDFDILIVASYCPDHGPDAVAGLQAGKHVYSEVTAFHTPAEGVALVEAVERSGRQYMLAENYCYLREAQEMQRLFQAGTLGPLLYAECEYVHDIRHLMLRNADGSHHWRNWLPPFYYNTHSLGPVLQIADLRPVSVIGQAVAGQIPGSLNPQDFCASFVRLDNGGLVRVLLSFSAVREPSSVWYALYGAKGMAESDRWQTSWGVTDLHVYQENDPVAEFAHTYRPRFPAEHRQALSAGHGGGDYFAIYHFLDALRTGAPPPIDVYRACDFTLPGILAYRSSLDNGASLTVPDFRDPQARAAYRHDDVGCPRDEAVRAVAPQPH